MPKSTAARKGLLLVFVYYTLGMVRLTSGEYSMEPYRKNLQDGYSQVAEEYAEKFFHELDGKPRDRELLKIFAEKVRGRGPVCDLGCGPGEVAHYLHQLGVPEVFGIDLAPEMVTQAKRLNPGLDFRQADFFTLPDSDDAWAGIAAFYCIVHVPHEEASRALKEWLRVLKPGGWLLLSFHIGSETVHPDDFLGKKVDITWYFFEVAEIVQFLKEAGFEAIEAIERAPYIGVEHPSQRGYVFAQKPCQAV